MYLPLKNQPNTSTIFLISPKLEMLTHCSSAHTQNIPVITQSNLKLHGKHNRTKYLTTYFVNRIKRSPLKKRR